jgi:hypothetical protein
MRNEKYREYQVQACDCGCEAPIEFSHNDDDGNSTCSNCLIDQLEEISVPSDEPQTGVDLIARERAEQFTKHQRSVRDDIERNSKGELSAAAVLLIQGEKNHLLFPYAWQYSHTTFNMIRKTNIERLIIAGALIAAEIDRLIEIDERVES